MLFKLEKFYYKEHPNAKEEEELRTYFAVTGTGQPFRIGVTDFELLPAGKAGEPFKVPEDWIEMALSEWVLLHFPISLEFHWGDEPPEAPAVTPPHVLTEQEQALDAKYQQDLKWWKRARNERIAKALDAAADIDSPFVTRETTEVTTEYSSPLCNKLLAAFIDGDEAPEDPIAWRRKAAAESKQEYMQAIVSAATAITQAFMDKKSGKDEKKPVEKKASTTQD